MRTVSIWSPSGRSCVCLCLVSVSVSVSVSVCVCVCVSGVRARPPAPKLVRNCISVCARMRACIEGLTCLVEGVCACARASG